MTRGGTHTTSEQVIWF